MFMLRLLTLLALAGTASAQTVSTWTGTGGNGNWNNSGNWDVVPLSGAGAALTFTGSAQLSTMNDLGPFTLSSVTFDGTVAASISGGPLTFVPGSSAAAITTQSGFGRLLFNSAVNFTSTTTITIEQNNGNGAELFFSGAVTNPAGNTITTSTTPPGTLILFTAANNTNFGGTWAQNHSTLSQLSAPNAMWRTTQITLTGTCAVTAGTTTAAGYGTPDAGYNQQIGSINGTGQFLVGTTNSSAMALVGFSNTDMLLSGSASLAGFNPGSHFGKVGTGTLTVTAENASYNTGYSVRAGSLTFGGALGSQSNSLANPGPISIYAGTMLRVSNATVPAYGGWQGRVSDTAHIRLAGGQFRYDGGATFVVLGGTGNSTIELVGTLRPFAGQSTVVVNAHAAQKAKLQFAAVAEANLDRGGQVAFIGTSLGATPANGVSGITLGGTVTTINGLLPWALSQQSYTSNTTIATPNVTDPDSLAEMGPNGVRPLSSFTDNSLTSATANVRLTTNVSANGGEANSLTLDAGSSLVLPSMLILTSGALLNRSTTGVIDGPGAVATTVRLYVSASQPLVINAPVIAAHISKGGNSSVTMNGAVTLGANPLVAVNAGTLTFGPAATVSGTPIYQVSKGATLANIPGTIFGGLRGDGTVSGPVVIGSGGRITGSSLAGGLASGDAPGVLTLTGPLTLEGGAIVRVNMSSKFDGPYTQSQINGTTLDLSSASPGNPIVIEIQSLLLSNDGLGPIYDATSTDVIEVTLGDFPGGITGFNANKFTFNSFGTPGTSFSIGQSGNRLSVSFVPVPEPMLAGFLMVLGPAILSTVTSGVQRRSRK